MEMFPKGNLPLLCWDYVLIWAEKRMTVTSSRIHPVTHTKCRCQRCGVPPVISPSHSGWSLTTYYWCEKKVVKELLKLNRSSDHQPSCVTPPPPHYKTHCAPTTTMSPSSGGGGTVVLSPRFIHRLSPNPGADAVEQPYKNTNKNTQSRN